MNPHSPSYTIPDFELLSFERRGVRSGINLGSNELQHPQLSNLHTLFNPRVTPLNFYPVHSQAATEIAAFIGRPEEQLIFSPGSDAAIRAIVGVAQSRGFKKLLYLSPAYPAWKQAATLYNLPFDTVVISGEREKDFEHLVSRIGAQTIVAVTWPNAPVAHGSFSVDELFALDARCREQGSELVVDLCYAPFFAPRHDLKQIMSSLNTVFTSSKAFGLAAARAAIVTGAPENISHLAVAGIENGVSQHALDLMRQCFASYSQYEPIWNDITQERDKVRQELLSIGMEVPTSEANFLHVFLTQEKAERIAQHLLQLGIRTKVNTALNWHTSIRFSIALDQIMGQLISELTGAWKEQK
ncbi:aminotransferase class I/II-fold pyridoxal phosphate-dependent enzyme [Lysinibacter sp. HNR]|uniref:aminotransferase class I/II-fold pyridoxal phosphate-dependent enzyme n=1 Tax=Lysinibacter sp. HNR TaxID=3031408 RepID=UPI002434CA59|nr:aminotransferase class I/II-fold pyridoxal phosphate-dependent enzyme [Lysinibacter sp. HNR]WGD37592.1 aminotransferase class I/II-fold pyridoxal phosphate-dependent enzyme [Lysinibacter sp. HNR]